MSFPSYFPRLGGKGAGASLSELVDLERLTLPTTLVLSPEGRLESVLRGPITADEAR